MTTTQTATSVTDLYYRRFNDGDLDGMVALFAPDYLGHSGLGNGAETVRRQLGAWYRAVPDVQVEIQQTVIEGDWVATFQVIRGTHTADLGPLPASGAKFSMLAVDFFRVADGRIVEGRTVCDLGALLLAGRQQEDTTSA